MANATTGPSTTIPTPQQATGKGTLDGKSSTLELPDGAKAHSQFDRFGIATSWIDGNSQDVYWDDITYTAKAE